MTKTTIQIPDWMDEEKLRKAIIQAISQATKELSIEEVRKIRNKIQRFNGRTRS